MGLIDRMQKLKSKLKKHLSAPEQFLEHLESKKNEELLNPPKIAIIGKTGVGKSTTINALFNTNLRISHTESCTEKPEAIILTNGNGEIIVYDMPGLGEDIDTDEKHKEVYKEILPLCDVVLWILNVEDREMTFQQQLLKEILGFYKNQLVICANKADLVFPNDWMVDYNLPSEEQDANLNGRIIDIRKKLQKIVGSLPDDRIIYFSAEKHYRLEHVFNAMMDACPKHRAWVLDSRKDLADFRLKMDKDILDKIQRQ